MEHVLSTHPHVLLYPQIPKKRLATGHEARHWNVGEPKWQGRLKILVRESKALILQFIEFDAPTVYLEAKPILLDDISEAKKLMVFHIQKVTDSSRYFVIFVESPDKKQRFQIGFGFNQRSEAFDFQATMSDFSRMYIRNAEEVDYGEVLGEDGEVTPIKVDEDPDKFTLKANMVLDTETNTWVERETNADAFSSFPDNAFLPPPPSKAKQKTKKKVTS